MLAAPPTDEPEDPNNAKSRRRQLLKMSPVEKRPPPQIAHSIVRARQSHRTHTIGPTVQHDLNGVHSATFIGVHDLDTARRDGEGHGPRRGRTKTRNP
ncbi:hypothetical protein N9L76_01780 [bacterium]|nr:hypothetical protein [bacterium]